VVDVGATVAAGAVVAVGAAVAAGAWVGTARVGATGVGLAWQAANKLRLTISGTNRYGRSMAAILFQPK